jgi:hypothetical protein
MESKECRRCKEQKLLTLFYPRANRLDGRDSYCIECTKEVAKESALKHNYSWFHEDGYNSEKEHFNAALQQMAKVFDMPSLLKYMK